MTDNHLQSLFSLENKTAIVTGAGGYLGKVFSECLIAAGAKVILFGRGNKIKELSHALNMKYGDESVDCELVNFYDEGEYRRCLNNTVDNNENIDILVNNAYEFSKATGFNDPSGKIETISKQQWMRSFESGVYWHSLATQVVGEMMKKQRSGSIINISSMYAVVSPDPGLYKGYDVFNPPSYGAAKAALLAFTRYTASFYGEYNIRCNAIVAGSFPNIDGNSYNSPQNDDFIELLKGKTVLKRCGKPEDLSGALIYLASDASGYVTGQSVTVDGGWTIT